MELVMSINPNFQLVPITPIKMLNESTKLLGLPKLEAQVILSLPNILEFNEKLKESINFSKDKIECFIITSSSKNEIEELAQKYELNKSYISNDFTSFAKTFNLKDEKNNLVRSIIMINKDCQIIHKEIL
jgi:thiol peroxidase